LIRSRKCLTPEPRALEGAFYAVVDRDRDSKADEVLTVARGLRMPDGALLVSDDEAGAVYRISYGSP